MARKFRYTHRNNPLSRKHPLLDRLVKAGLNFRVYCKPTVKGDVAHVIYSYGEHSACLLSVWADGKWNYDDISLPGPNAREAVVTTDAELQELVKGSRLEAEGVMFKYRLFMFNDALNDL